MVVFVGSVVSVESSSFCFVDVRLLSLSASVHPMLTRRPLGHKPKGQCAHCGDLEVQCAYCGKFWCPGVIEHHEQVCLANNTMEVDGMMFGPCRIWIFCVT